MAHLAKTKEKMAMLDNFLLNLAVDGKADYLVTGDKDLLDLKKLEKKDFPGNP